MWCVRILQSLWIKTIIQGFCNFIPEIKKASCLVWQPVILILNQNTLVEFEWGSGALSQNYQTVFFWLNRVLNLRPRKLGQPRSTRGANGSLMKKHFTILETLLPWNKGTIRYPNRRIRGRVTLRNFFEKLDFLFLQFFSEPYLVKKT